jgi:alkanesulfonate monooxygenase SsuD/methylene tetrahydromethanopterin reductase-like flavin-dependent oxidoreductase (luciferase family)
MANGEMGSGVAFGVDAGLAPDVAATIATTCAALGYESLWTNDDPGASGLETLGHFATAVPALPLGVGVLPLDRWPPSRIAAEVERLGLEPSRLRLGIGSGRLHPQLEPVRTAVAELRRMLPASRIVVAAIRPQLARLGGALADGVLLNWMVPSYARIARGWVDEGAAAAARPAPPVATYVRVAVGAGAHDRLRTEEARYRTISEGQRRHFGAMGAPLGSVGVAAPDRARVVAGIAAYRDALDLTIVRALAARDAELIEVAIAAAPNSSADE